MDVRHFFGWKMNDFFPEKDLDIIPGHCDNEQKKRSCKNAQENIPVLDQEGKDKIECIKVDHSQAQVQGSIRPEITFRFIDIPWI
jgi:hypothetical protein